MLTEFAKTAKSVNIARCGLFPVNHQKTPRQLLSADGKTDKNIKKHKKVRGSRKIDPDAGKTAILFYIIT